MKKSPARYSTPDEAQEKRIPADSIAHPQGKGKVIMIETMTPAKTAVYLRERGMRIQVDTLCRGIQQGVYPFGLCITGGKSPVYQIFKNLLDEWVAAHSVEGV